jgi:acyl-CoA thioester hydrolase
MAQVFIHRVADLPLSEFDLGGVLYHANYYHLYERGREALLRENGLPYSELVAAGCHLAIVEAHQEFRSPVYYGEVLTLELRISDIRSSSAKIGYTLSTVRNNDRKELHRGWTVLAFVSTSQGRFKASRFPEKLLGILKKYAES